VAAIGGHENYRTTPELKKYVFIYLFIVAGGVRFTFRVAAIAACQ